MSSNESAVSDPYSSTAVHVLFIVGGILLFLGTVASIMAVIVFTHKTMRVNAGCVYFSVYHAMNLLLMHVGCFTIWLPLFMPDPALSNIVYCKLQFFARTTLFTLVPYYVVLASIDRALITSSKVSVRQWSTHRFAYYSILGVTLFFVLFYIHHLVIVNVYEFYPITRMCYYPPGTYRVFMSIFDLITHGSLPSLLLIIFGTICLKNVHRGRRIQQDHHVQNANNSRRVKDRQLLLFLLVEIIGYVPLSLSTTSFNIYRESTQNEVKSVATQTEELFVSMFLYLIYFIPTSINFYIYILVSKPFRRKVFEILFRSCLNRRATGFVINGHREEGH